MGYEVADLRAGQVASPRDFVLLRCPEARCDHLLLKALPEGSGQMQIETKCPVCKTVAVWTLRDGQRPVYQALPREI
jgi:phage FluMu protein Com